MHSRPGAGASNELGAADAAVVLGDCLDVLAHVGSGAAQLVYADPPFNTGRARRGSRTTAIADVDGVPGFAGRNYQRLAGVERSYDDRIDDFPAFLAPRLEQMWRVLAPTGTLYLHLDYREAHYAKVMLDQLVGREHFLNEIIWAYDYGARTTRRWPAKHDTILVYVKDPDDYFFNSSEVDREPYMAPGLVTAEKAERGKLPTDVWWHTIVPTAGSERTGYPTQKPEGVLRRIITASSRPGDLVIDPFAGSGTTGAVARKLGRRTLLVDENPQAIEVIRQRIPEIMVVDTP